MKTARRMTTTIWRHMIVKMPNLEARGGGKSVDPGLFIGFTRDVMMAEDVAEEVPMVMEMCVGVG